MEDGKSRAKGNTFDIIILKAIGVLDDGYCDGETDVAAYRASVDDNAGISEGRVEGSHIAVRVLVELDTSVGIVGGHVAETSDLGAKLGTMEGTTVGRENGDKLVATAGVGLRSSVAIEHAAAEMATGTLLGAEDGVDRDVG